MKNFSWCLIHYFQTTTTTTTDCLLSYKCRQESCFSSHNSVRVKKYRWFLFLSTFFSPYFYLVFLGDCIDYDKHCGTEFPQAKCTTHPDLMEKLCPKMCQMCSKLMSLSNNNCLVCRSSVRELKDSTQSRTLNWLYTSCQDIFNGIQTTELMLSFVCVLPSECPLECQNGGTLNRQTCTCSCSTGWTGTDCTGILSC